MHFSFYLLWSFATIVHVSCFLNVCHDSRKNEILLNEECSDLYFEPSEKETRLGDVELDLENNTLYVTPKELSWNTAFLRIKQYKDQSKKFCSKFFHKNYCLIFTNEAINQTFLLEYKAEKHPETNSRKFLFSVPSINRAPIFPYIDLTDTSRLILKTQKYSNYNITSYRIEAFKEKNNATTLQDLRLFQPDRDIFYEFYTYNDEGTYFFIISAICGHDLCFQTTTPKVFIGRKSTRLVIGIVGASFILPFVLFIFHVITKKYSNEESRQPGEEGLLVVYKSSSLKKHSDIVILLAALLEKFNKNEVNVDILDLSKSTKKFCADSITSSNRVIYVAPPRTDSENVILDKALLEKEISFVIFDYCTEKLPQCNNQKIFKLFDEIDKFVTAFDISEPYDNSLYLELQRKTEEAKFETERYLKVEILPKIVVTDEPQEHDKLISSSTIDL